MSGVRKLLRVEKINEALRRVSVGLVVNHRSKKEMGK